MKLLDGIRVVEMGVWVAAPAIGGVMADWGAARADIAKVPQLMIQRPVIRGIVNPNGLAVSLHIFLGRAIVQVSKDGVHGADLSSKIFCVPTKDA